MRRFITSKSWAWMVVCFSLFIGVGTASAARRSVRVVSFNVWGLPSPLLAKPSRIKFIPEALSGLDADVISIQEAFSKKTKPVQSLADFPFVVHGPAGGKGLNLSSGILIHSKWPIIETATIRYSECKSFDCFAHKGALYARIRFDDIGEVDFFTTHMNAGSDDWVRISQVKELERFIHQRHDPRLPLVVFGDFNIKEGMISYDLMTQMLALRDSHKEWRDATPGLSPIVFDGYTMDPRRNGNIKWMKPFVKPHRIDYVWLKDADGEHMRIDNSQMVFDHKVHGKFLSDHFGLLADLVIDTAYRVE